MDFAQTLSTMASSFTTQMPLPMSDMLWSVILGFIISFILSIAIGANDVANSFGTSVGSKVLTLRQALFLATIFETLGAVLLGSNVVHTIQKGLIDVSLYEGMEETLMVGEISALMACAVWLFIATAFKLPVSTTHSVVGATVGFHLVVFGFEGVKWLELGLIALSWLTSPLMSGLCSALIFFIVRKFIINKEEPLEPGLISLPFWYGLVIIINLFSIFYEGPEILGFDKIPLWGVLVLSFGSGFVTGLIVWFIAVPWLRKRIIEKHGLLDGKITYSNYGANSNTAFHIEEKIGGDKSERGVQTDEDGITDSIEKLPVNGKLIVSVDEIIPNEDKLPIVRSVEKVALEDSDAYLEKESTGDEQGVHECYASEASESSFPGGANGTAADFMERGGVGECGDQVVLAVGREGGEDSVTESSVSSEEEVKDHPHVAALCSPLQILSAVFASFAHGGNDVSNAVAPLIAIWLIYQTGDASQEEPVPLWVLFYGAMGISLGLWSLGRRVIETVGEDITKLTPSSGFAVEIGTATTVLMASNVGIPISTTHCKVGSVVSVGWVRMRKAVNWSLFGTIILAWVVTLPATVGLGAGIMALLQLSV